MQVLWLRFLTEIDENTREAPAELLENTEVNEALEILERAAFTDAEMRAYDKFWDRVSTMRTIESDWEDKINEAKVRLNETKDRLNETKDRLNETKDRLNETKDRLNETKDKLNEAEAKLKQKDVDFARKLKAMNVMTTGQIAEATGLTAEEIEGL
jgi:chromosome segregation ATPase